MKSTIAALPLLLLVPVGSLHSQGNVYLVLGSDTAIWEGMDVGRYHCTYALSLFTDPARNAARVMDPAFRQPLRDSYGTPVKLTWWMMAGNIFRHATNTNVPNPNTMTMYLMQKYEGEGLRTWGDEFTLHYHTFVWTDYNRDGVYYWNQALSFAESSEDFDVTLAQMLLEEGQFPVSFRSGWHAMDNGWQQRLDTFLPYSLHNDWPARHTDLTEPLDNIYDWSRAPGSFVPFHPSPTDYQVPGDCRGWNVRSAYMSSADSAFMDRIFAQAAAGTDQVVCLWAHLPETDFLDNIRRVDASAHKVAPKFPGVNFRYCTAVEAMQRWRTTDDTTRPHVTLEEIPEGATVRWAVTSDEPLFQPAPFVAAKDKYGEYQVLPCRTVGGQSWETTISLPRADLAKVGVAATDTAGNLMITLLPYLADDIFIDNVDPGYEERAGTWFTSSNAAWGTSSRYATLGAADSAVAVWSVPITTSGLYNVHLQVPSLSAAAQLAEVRVIDGAQTMSSTSFSSGIPGGRWVYIGTPYMSSGSVCSVVLTAYGNVQPGTQLAADAVRISPLVRDQWLVVPETYDAGEMIVEEESVRTFPIRNEGIQPVVVTAVSSTAGTITPQTLLPVTVPPMGETAVTLAIQRSFVGPLTDTLIIASDDPRHPEARSVVRGNVQEYFALVDDRDSLSYAESGAWYFSVAQAFGPSSRYAYPAPGVSATFSARLRKEGMYEIREIVPTTVNASVRARYVLLVSGARVDSAFIDQNVGSGNWVGVLQRQIPPDVDVRIELTDAMSPIVAGKVLRADAVRFQWVGPGLNATQTGPGNLPTEFALGQNYPNPFNPSTRIAYQIPVGSEVNLTVFDLLGRPVATLVDGRKSPGHYQIGFDAGSLASGVYLYRLTAGSFAQTRKMMVIK
ncbi:MAG: T9SS type A sorting domain-containing protein [Bacteroidota bacterium]